MTQENYLETELNQLVHTDIDTRKFLQVGFTDGVWYWDLEHPENEWMSPEFWRTLGIHPASNRADPRDWQKIIFEDDLRTLMHNFEAHCADPNHPYDQVVRYRHANGSTVWIRTVGFAVRNDAGQPVRMLSGHTDITEVKRSQRDARAGWIAAEAANEELKTFSYSVSHDMKAPANTLDLLLKEFILQNEGKLDEDSLEILSMCTETVARMKNLVEEVLDFTRAIEMPAEKSNVSLSDVVAKVLQNLEQEIATSAAEIEVEPLPDVHAAPVQMEILMQNLISNAIKYGPTNRATQIRIQSDFSPDENVFRITVTDNGMGILAENQDRIFKLFQRLHSHSEIPGSGIGLPMCKRIAVNHSGDIELVSSLGKGSAFSLRLPIDALT